ncbi:hypothetical protein EV426DRAFT_707013 [Tirmania nivea]|nr:hypothetical protein EV426DRAFT_707013 [Tirmania nivea]
MSTAAGLRSGISGVGWGVWGVACQLDGGTIYWTACGQSLLRGNWDRTLKFESNTRLRKRGGIELAIHPPRANTAQQTKQTIRSKPKGAAFKDTRSLAHSQHPDEPPPSRAARAPVPRTQQQRSLRLPQLGRAGFASGREPTVPDPADAERVVQRSLGRREGPWRPGEGEEASPSSSPPSQERQRAGGEDCD